jgi:hypothetical protein
MILTEIAGFCRRCADCTNVANPDAFTASDALTDNIDRPLFYYANGFGRACPDTVSMSAAQGFIKLYEA